MDNNMKLKRTITSSLFESTSMSHICNFCGSTTNNRSRGTPNSNHQSSSSSIHNNRNSSRSNSSKIHHLQRWYSAAARNTSSSIMNNPPLPTTTKTFMLNKIIRRYFGTTTTPNVDVNLYDNLKQRGLVNAATADDASMKELLSKKISLYAGFDPTADSLHIGNLLLLVAMAHFQRAGHNVIAVIGGATGMIGDPSGRSTERSLLQEDVVENNAKKISETIARCLSRSSSTGGSFKIVNNMDWTRDMTVITFLRDFGKFFRVSNMLAKDSIKSRLSTEEGISFTEFSYQLLQSYDFFELMKRENCLLQLGGSDQWGNITAGIDVISKITRKGVYGMTLPLVTTSTGEKIGKSTGGGGLWLDSHKTTEYEFYQHWLRTDDNDALRYLKLYSFLSVAELQKLETEHRREPEKRLAQRCLADELIRFVHGEEGYGKAVGVTNILFTGDILKMKKADVLSMKDALLKVKREELIGADLLDLAVKAGIAPSKAEGRRLIGGGGLYLNNVKIQQIEKNQKIQESHLIDQSFVVLRTGKKNYKVVLME